MPSLGQLTASSSQFANKRGLYLGRRSTKFHVALYRRSGGRMGGHIPGWPEARIALVDHTGAKSGAKRTSPLMYLEAEDPDRDSRPSLTGSMRETRTMQIRVFLSKRLDENGTSSVGT